VSDTPKQQKITKYHQTINANDHTQITILINPIYYFKEKKKTAFLALVSLVLVILFVKKKKALQL